MRERVKVAVFTLALLVGAALVTEAQRDGRINGVAAGLRAVDGSATVPSIAFAADTDTGFYRAGSGQINYTFNGAVGPSFNGTTFGATGGGTFDTFVMSSVEFASLGTPANGTIKYCSDCTFANPCAGSGTGAVAKRLNGAWRCD